LIKQFQNVESYFFLSRRFLLSSAASAGQDVRQMATASELAKKRSLQGRMAVARAVVTTSTDGSVKFYKLWESCAS
jgi:hypothetical protein